MTKEFAKAICGNAAFSTAFDPVAGAERRAAEAVRVADMLGRATPPEAMQVAPVAPARGPMQLVQGFDLAPGGTRRRASAHWRAACALVVMVEQARQRHDAERPFVPPFTAAHLATAAAYRALTEWRDGSGIKCASIEAGRACAGDESDFLQRNLDRGRELDKVHRAIGAGVAMSPRRHMDRDNARHAISDRAVVDMVVLAGRDLSAVLRAYGWQPKGEHRKLIRAALCGSLDRMRDLLG